MLVCVLWHKVIFRSIYGMLLVIGWFASLDVATVMVISLSMLAESFAE